MYSSLFPHGLERYGIGGALIGLGVAFLFVMTGRQGGASTFFSSLWSWWLRTPFFRQPSLLEERGWRLFYALGFVLGGALYVWLGLPHETSQLPPWRVILGSLLVGFGARLGGGCTSGHGICGMASLSLGSFLIVLTFLATAIATAMTLAALGVPS